ncbi:BRCT domain containing protein [Parasponia andersonii]|uniref:BRCT domain containing protein n=1 Tax=Parasponia andersonii TaxID=3476 RepID=A0A2P5E426_PARAD|nr:BRCT domain containing protein [Parasponia andersonii]
MGSLGDDDGANNSTKRNSVVDDPDSETQYFNSQAPTPAFSGGEVEFGDVGESVQGTMPVDEVITVEDAFETQFLDLADETQVMDFGVETQVVNLCGETQVLDDVNCIEHMETQLLDVFEDDNVGESDGEGTDCTEVLGDKDDISDDELGGENGSQSEDKAKGQCFSVLKYSEEEPLEQPKTSSKEQNHSELRVHTVTPVPQASVEPKPGSQSMRLTSVRAASLRASGLAARNMSSKGTQSLSSSIPTSNMSSEKFDVNDNAVSTMKSGKDGDQDPDLGRFCEVINGSRSESMCRVGNLAVRKLFTETLDRENEDLPYDTSRADGVDSVQMHACDVAGLSYVQSQEPGELSQLNALNFVDRFLEENAEEFDKEIDCGKSTGGKSELVSTVIGPQMLAKKANRKSIIGELGIYDWDDNREDEGGGDILCRRKEDFFGGGSLGRRPSRSGFSRMEEQKDCRKQLNGNNKRMDVFNSDSKLLSHNFKAEGNLVFDAEGTLKRNLIKELDKQSDVDFGKQMENDASKTDVPEMYDVGFDTQMAAEAMEALFYGEDTAKFDVNDACQGAKKRSNSCKGPKQPLSRKLSCVNDIGFASKQSKKTKRVNVSLVSSEKQSKNVRKQSKADPAIKKSKEAKENEEYLNTNESKNSRKMSSQNIKKRKAGCLNKGISELDSDNCTGNTSGSFSANKQHMQEKVSGLGPIACRTRRSMAASNRFKNAENESIICREEMNNLTEVVLNEKRNKSIGIQALKVLTSRDAQSSKFEFANMAAPTNSNKLGALSCPRGRRSSRILSCQVCNSDKIDDPSVPSVQPEVGQTITRHSRSCRQTRSSKDGHPITASVEQDLDRKLLQQGLDGILSGNAESGQRGATLTESPREKSKPSDLSCTTPVNRKIPINNVSPICMGNEYVDETCKRSLSRPSLLREICSLSATGPQATSVSKDLRKRREMADIRILYSHHLDDDIIKLQKKVLARLGASVASSITDATHFIADQFVRTRNMLEAIASGKPVVIPLWLDSCGQAKCFLDEKKYILRDAKKEKEFGFSMPASLACASQHPLLQGLRVLITPNTKPGIEIISSLVKAVQGQAVERIGRSALKDGVFPDDLLVLSCEEDYAICVPFLEKGAAIYSSELLLNGIVTQKLEYERYKLFTDHIKKTRSTLWLRKDGSKFLPVAKRKTS